jgi:hypothetical protein
MPMGLGQGFALATLNQSEFFFRFVLQIRMILIV